MGNERVCHEWWPSSIFRVSRLSCVLWSQSTVLDSIFNFLPEGSLTTHSNSCLDFHTLETIEQSTSHCLRKQFRIEFFLYSTSIDWSKMIFVVTLFQCIVVENSSQIQLSKSQTIHSTALLVGREHGKDISRRFLYKTFSIRSVIILFERSDMSIEIRCDRTFHPLEKNLTMYRQ
jgi:hypothetical protein